MRNTTDSPPYANPIRLRYIMLTPSNAKRNAFFAEQAVSPLPDNTAEKARNSRNNGNQGTKQARKAR
jgi:hypothetical protein